MKCTLILLPQLPSAVHNVSGRSYSRKTTSQRTQNTLVCSILVSQGSAAMHLRFDGILNDCFIANCPQSVPVDGI